MDERFLRSCYSGRHRVLGLNLLPYSLSHLLALEAIESPLVQSGTRGTAKDLVNAVRICNEVQFHDGPYTFRRTKHKSYDYYAKLRLDLSGHLLDRETLKFFRYMNEHCLNPEFWDLDRSVDGELVECDSKITGPYVLAQFSSVMMHYPQISEARAWTMSIGLLGWYNGQISEFKYNSRFYNLGQEAEIETNLQKAEAEITPAMREKALKLAQRRGGLRA